MSDDPVKIDSGKVEQYLSIDKPSLTLQKQFETGNEIALAFRMNNKVS